MINVYEEPKSKYELDQIFLRNNSKQKEQKGRVVLSNAFSVNMLKHDGYLFFSQIDLEMAKYIIAGTEILSIIGHQSTAELLSAKLGIPVLTNRINYIKQKNDQIIVCLPSQRLEEGKVLTLEELNQIEIKFWLVK
ncbi:MAG: STIV orfB116 family protein [bacterium]